jgi:hypothetical protein
MQNTYKYIDLSGYSFTGKGAYNHLFLEFSTFHTHPYDFEFDLVRTRGGVLDLYNALVVDWSPVRSSECIRDFKKNIALYGGKNTLLDRLTTNGRHYEYVFPGFKTISEKYINSLIDSKWKGQWPYAFDRNSKLQMSTYKLLSNLGYKDIYQNDVYLSSCTEDDFALKTKKYLNDILTIKVESSANTIVMNNVFEPFDPLRMMQFFDNAKSIVIDRDPRDIYLSALNYVHHDGSKGWDATLGKNVEDFILKFKTYRNNINDKTDNQSLLRLTFEELVLNYNHTLNRLFDFIEEDSSIHKYQKKYFNPDLSKQNVGAWKNAKGRTKEDVEKIYTELKDYCKDY